MRFSITIKLGQQTVSHVMGLPVEKRAISLQDMEKVFEVAQFLEKLLGHRVHITQEE